MRPTPMRLPLKSSGRLISPLPMMLWVKTFFTEPMKTKSVLPLRNARIGPSPPTIATLPLPPLIAAVTMPDEAI